MGIIGYLDFVLFKSNSVSANGNNGKIEAFGGAIYNAHNPEMPLNILSLSGETLFVGNSANGKSNAIHNISELYAWYSNGIANYGTPKQSVVNLNAGNFDISILDGISGNMILSKEGYNEDGRFFMESHLTTQDAYKYNTININKPDTLIPLYDSEGNQTGDFSAPTHGTVTLANTIDGNTVNMYDGTLRLTHHIYTPEESPILANQLGVANFTNNTALNIYGGNLTTQDNAVFNHHLGNLTLHNNITMQVDANLYNKTMDTISINTFNNPNDSTITINNINIVKPTKEQTITIPFISQLNKNNTATPQEISNLANTIKYTGGDVAYSPVYIYKAGYDKSTGSFTFDKQALNPSILATPVAAQSGAIANQVATFQESFYNMDSFMMRDVNERIMMRDRNKYASSYSSGMLWDDAITRRDNREMWLRPYVTFENVPLKNGPKVDNISYGTFFGTNSPIKQLKYGFDGAYGVYVAYNGSKQSYSNTNVYQNGATLGLVGELYKKNFFTGLSLSVGSSIGSADTMYGTDNFTMLTSGIASKTGYNFEFKNGRFILQPTILLGYSFVNTFDYTNSAGVKISSDPLHSIHIEPGIRFIANLKNGWKPYAGVSMVWNAMNKAKYYADDIALPETSIKPYVKYGVGVQKTFSERLSSFAQAFVTNGGRNGVGLQAGVSFVLDVNRF